MPHSFYVISLSMPPITSIIEKFTKPILKESAQYTTTTHIGYRSSKTHYHGGQYIARISSHYLWYPDGGNFIRTMGCKPLLS